MDWISVGYCVGLGVLVVVLNRVWDNALKRIQEKDAEEKMRNMKTNNDKVMNGEENDSIPEVERDNLPGTVDPETKQLLVDTLEKLKLEAKVDEDFKEFVMTDFQGEHFRIKIENKKFIEVQDLHWYEAPLDDLDNLLTIQKAMNWINMTTTCRMVYTIDNDDNMVNLHTQAALLWIPEIPDIDQYLEATLRYMLQVKNIFYSTMEKIRRAQYESENAKR